MNVPDPQTEFWDAVHRKDWQALCPLAINLAQAGGEQDTGGLLLVIATLARMAPPPPDERKRPGKLYTPSEELELGRDYHERMSAVPSGDRTRKNKTS